MLFPRFDGRHSKVKGDRVKKYRVLEFRQKKLTGRFHSKLLEGVLNREARDGWLFERTLGGETFFLGHDTVMLVFSQSVEAASEIPESSLSLPPGEDRSDLDGF
jgi:hypothetical protein